MNLQVGFRGIGVQRHVVFKSDLQGLLHRYCKAQVCRPVIEKTYLFQGSLLWHGFYVEFLKKARSFRLQVHTHLLDKEKP